MEKILCAAIWYKTDEVLSSSPKNIEKGRVICGFRHSNIIRLYYSLFEQPTRRETSVQGFLTSHNRFVNRLEANKIAMDSGQVPDNTEGDELISEDLY